MCTYCRGPRTRTPPNSAARPRRSSAWSNSKAAVTLTVGSTAVERSFTMPEASGAHVFFLTFSSIST
eukprot:14528876-Heterocapsa_arctica.AAC.1